MLQKLMQMRAAYALEQHWSRQQILEAYLNLVTWRGELQGVSAATWILFDKVPHGVSGSEALVMAALLRAPNAKYNVVLRRTAVLRPLLAPDEPRWPDLTSAVDRVFASPHGASRRVELAPHVAARLLGDHGMSVRSTLDRSNEKPVPR